MKQHSSDESKKNQELNERSDRFLEEQKKYKPHKNMKGDKIQAALSQIFSGGYLTNFNSAYIDDCVEEEILIFTIDKEEKDKFNDFVKKHEGCEYLRNPYRSADFGFNLTFSFRDTSVGMRTIVKCNCGFEEDITAYESW